METERVEKRDVRKGMTLIELSMTLAIAGVLLGLILGLSRHVNDVLRIRQAQTALGAWEMSLERWREKFGEYPHSDRNGGELTFHIGDAADKNLSNLVENAEANLSGKITRFDSFLLPGAKLIDPWGMPYVYLPEEGNTSYSIFSRGPDAQSGKTKYDMLDDVYFER